MAKPRIIKDYDKLPPEVVEQVKLVYPMGFAQHLIPFTNKDGQRRKGLPFETEDYIYLIRMSEDRAREIVEDDDDYDEDGMLREDVHSEYADKYEDEDFLHELNSNDDNTLGD